MGGYKSFFFSLVKCISLQIFSIPKNSVIDALVHLSFCTRHSISMSKRFRGWVAVPVWIEVSAGLWERTHPVPVISVASKGYSVFPC